MSKPTIIRPLFGVGLYAAVALVSAIAIVLLLMTPGPVRNLGPGLALPILIIGLGWVLLVAPKVAFDADGIRIDNPLRRTRVPRERIEGVDTHRGFRVLTDEGPIQAWAAPPPSRLEAARLASDGVERRAASDPRVLRDADRGVRASAAPGTLSGDAAMSAKHYGHLEPARVGDAGADRPAIERSWAWPSLAIAGASLIAAAAALLLR